MDPWRTGGYAVVLWQFRARRRERLPGMPRRDCLTAPASVPSCGTRLDGEPGRRPTERKVVTTLFADLVGFTALGERHDPEDVDAALRAYYALARSIIERFGGTVEKFIGDAVVGLFGVPHGARGRRRARGARGARDRRPHATSSRRSATSTLQVRCAVNTGPALVRLDARPETGEGVLVGDAVNTAARLSRPRRRDDGDGRGSHAPTDAAGHRTTAALPPSQRQGQGQAGRALAGRTAPSRATAPTPTAATSRPMVGREVELAVLAGLLDRAVASSSPQFALVTGEAGHRQVPARP